MDWLNLHVSVLDSPEFLGADPVDRATWLCMLRYCIGQENDGRVGGATEWNDRRWQQVVRITKREATRRCELWHFDGSDLVVWNYPSEKQKLVQTKRDAGRLGGSAKTQAKTQAATANGALGGRPENPSKTQAETQGKWKGKGNRKSNRKGNGNGGEAPPPPSDVASAESISPSLAEWTTYAHSIGYLDAADAEQAWHNYEATKTAAGWWQQRGGKKITNWRAACVTCRGNWERFRGPGRASRTGVGRGEKFGGVAPGAGQQDGFDSTAPDAHTGGVPVAEPVAAGESWGLPFARAQEVAS